MNREEPDRKPKPCVQGFGLIQATTMTPEQTQFVEDSKAYIRANRTRLCKELTDTRLHPKEEQPVSVFMAGSPGAGKTETSKAYLKQFQETDAQGNITSEVLRIDPDDYRLLVPGYTGDNSWLVQPAVSLLVERVLDRALQQKQSFLLDGTFSNLEKSLDNISRCLKKDRFVQILYVYQQPQLAWNFVVARESIEGRKIPFDRFAVQFIAAQDAVQAALDTFGDQIRVEVLVKPIDNGRHLHHPDVKRLDAVVPRGLKLEDIYTLCHQELP